jgi:signal transduction histidine kinase
LRPIFLATFILLVVALLTIPTARRITRPVRRLIGTAKRFGDGDLSARAPVRDAPHGRRHDELRELAVAFNDMADRVEAIVRSQRELLANVSHELRSPLARIRMAMNLLPEEAATAARLRGVDADLNDLDRLIEDVLTTARLEETRLPTRLDTFDARRLLIDIAERARQDPVLDERLVDVGEGGAAPLCADEALLRRALWNLVENAAKYGAPPITLAARPSGDSVVVSVTDQGSGIPAAERERVFAPFYRADRARTPDGRHGVGLGLTLARRIAEVHGGTITIESGDGGRGCRVVITLPSRPPA